MKLPLSFDGCGINGPDEFRTRLCTFVNLPQWGNQAIIEFGCLFAASPRLLASVKSLLALADCGFGHVDEEKEVTALEEARAAVRQAEGDVSQTDSKEKPALTIPEQKLVGLLREMLTLSDARGVILERTAKESALADKVSDLLAQLTD